MPRKRVAKGSCSKCGGDGGVHLDRFGWCDGCRSTYMRDYYANNKEKFRESWQRTKARNKALVDSMKDVPCADCGMRYPPWVMDFDHRSGEVKVANVARLRKTNSVQRILDEAEKCDIVCSNCHRHRTHLRAMGAPLGTLQNRSAGDASVVGGA